MENGGSMRGNLLVVVEDSVHALDPGGVHGPVEHDPLALAGGAVGVSPEGAG